MHAARCRCRDPCCVGVGCSRSCSLLWAGCWACTSSAVGRRDPCRRPMSAAVISAPSQARQLLRRLWLRTLHLHLLKQKPCQRLIMPRVRPCPAIKAALLCAVVRPQVATRPWPATELASPSPDQPHQQPRRLAWFPTLPPGPPKQTMPRPSRRSSSPTPRH